MCNLTTFHKLLVKVQATYCVQTLSVTSEKWSLPTWINLNSSYYSGENSIEKKKCWILQNGTIADCTSLASILNYSTSNIFQSVLKKSYFSRSVCVLFCIVKVCLCFPVLFCKVCTPLVMSALTSCLCVFLLFDWLIVFTWCSCVFPPSPPVSCLGDYSCWYSSSVRLSVGVRSLSKLNVFTGERVLRPVLRSRIFA